MIQRKSTFFIGMFIILTEIFFGFPSSWKVVLIVLSGLALMALSVKITLPKKGLKVRPRRREKVTPVFVESMPVQSRETGQRVPNETHGEKNSTDDIVM